MKCPHCDGSISVLAKEANQFGKQPSRCSHCEQPVRIALSFKIAALLFVPAVFLALVLQSVFVGYGLSGSLAMGLVTGVLVLLSLRLKPA